MSEALSVLEAIVRESSLRLESAREYLAIVQARYDAAAAMYDRACSALCAEIERTNP
jgi:hypothetical protein